MSAARPAIYFGCWQRAGHYFFGPGMRSLRHADVPEALRDDIDGRYPPGGRKAGEMYPRDDTPQVEGLATVTQRGAWTVLAFWDRSVDTRRGSNSAFLLHGQHDFTAALALARAAFPEVFARFTFEVWPAAPVPA